jgi:hypothetical protein
LQPHHAERFERDMGCSEAEWLGWLPAALGAHPWEREGSSIRVRIGTRGSLTLDWRVAAPRVIALVRIPRLLVNFRFDGLDDDERQVFMKRLDLYLQRGGG